MQIEINANTLQVTAKGAGIIFPLLLLFQVKLGREARTKKSINQKLSIRVSYGTCDFQLTYTHTRQK